MCTVGLKEKCDRALANGAAHAINYRQGDFAQQVRDITEGRGVDAVMDSVGKDTFEGSLNSLRPLGTLISFGQASGQVPPVDLGMLSAKGSLSIARPSLFTHIAKHEDCQQIARELFAKATSGAVKVTRAAAR